jgi:hypothetical protein
MLPPMEVPQQCEDTSCNCSSTSMGDQSVACPLRATVLVRILMMLMHVFAVTIYGSCPMHAHLYDSAVTTSPMCCIAPHMQYNNECNCSLQFVATTLMPPVQVAESPCSSP